MQNHYGSATKDRKRLAQFGFYASMHIHENIVHVAGVFSQNNGPTNQPLLQCIQVQMDGGERRRCQSCSRSKILSLWDYRYVADLEPYGRSSRYVLPLAPDVKLSVKSV